MNLKRSVLLLIVGCLLTLTASRVFAQLDLDETYTASDSSFEFKYPSDWEVNDDGFEDSGFIFLNGEIGRNNIAMGFAGPEIVGTWTDNANSFDEVLESLTEIFNFNDETDLEIDNRTAIAAIFELQDARGLAITIEMEDGDFGIVLIVTTPANAMDRVAEEILQIVATYDSVSNNGGRNNSGIGSILGSRDGDEEDESETVTSLSAYDSENWRDTIAELEDEGLIGSGGILIFNENRAFFDGVGSWFTPLARRTSRRDIVMAAEIEFDSGSREFETCGLMARILSEPNQTSVTTFLEVGIENNGSVYWFDSAGNDIDSGLAHLNLDLDETHHLLFLALNDSLTIYVNGELTFDNIRIQARSGSFGISLIGRDANSRCIGRNIWAYDAPIFIVGFCEVASGGTVNKRSGPGTNFDRAGTLANGERLEVNAQAEDASGFTWYELEDNSWVREDVISLLGDCGNIPDS